MRFGVHFEYAARLWKAGIHVHVGPLFSTHCEHLVFGRHPPPLPPSLPPSLTLSPSLFPSLAALAAKGPVWLLAPLHININECFQRCF